MSLLFRDQMLEALLAEVERMSNNARPRGARSRRSSQVPGGRPGSLLRRARLADVMENFAPEALVVAIADECVDRVASSPYRAA